MKVLAMILLTTFGAGAAAAADPQWNPEVFPISFWCGPPEGEITVERYREIRDAGFTYAMPACDGGSSAALNLKRLDAAQQAGIKAFIQDSRTPNSIGGSADAKARIDAIVADYAHHPALAGYFITDEPSLDAIEGLAEVFAYFREKDPAHPAYVNLFPNYVGAHALGGNGYENYVEEFAKKARPFVICYDHYHFTHGGDGPLFFDNLDIVERVARKHDLPFWQIVLLISHGPYRELTEPEKRWEAMQTLAHGAKGLMFFTYWTPRDPSFEWKPAMIDLDGNRTRHYDEVRRINKDVRAIGDVLLNASFDGVLRTNEPDKASTSVRETIQVAGASSPVSIGLFQREHDHLALIANQSYTSETQVRLQLPRAKRVEKLEKPTGKWSALQTAESAVQIAPGDAELLRWRK
jgi:hypothetical protein